MISNVICDKTPSILRLPSWRVRLEAVDDRHDKVIWTRRFTRSWKFAYDVRQVKKQSLIGPVRSTGKYHWHVAVVSQLGFPWACIVNYIGWQYHNIVPENTNSALRFEFKDSLNLLIVSRRVGYTDRRTTLLKTIKFSISIRSSTVISVCINVMGFRTIIG